MDKNSRENPGLQSRFIEYSFLQHMIPAFFILWVVCLWIVPFYCMAGAPGKKPEYTQRFTDLCVSRVDGDAMTWELKADEAKVQENGERAILREIKLSYFLVSGQDVMMRGDQAEVDFPNNLIAVMGGIRAESRMGLSLETETLLWDGKQRSLSTKDRVVIKRPNIEMSGQGLEADLDLEKIRIKADAKTVIY
jgi:LPS export ABC transporter protein LptC